MRVTRASKDDSAVEFPARCRRILLEPQTLCTVQQGTAGDLVLQERRREDRVPHIWHQITRSQKELSKREKESRTILAVPSVSNDQKSSRMASMFKGPRNKCGDTLSYSVSCIPKKVYERELLMIIVADSTPADVLPRQSHAFGDAETA